MSKKDPKDQIKKHLPKRVTNANLKARRAASWERGQVRKAERRAEQARQEQINKELRAQGLPTAHQAKKR